MRSIPFVSLCLLLATACGDNNDVPTRPDAPPRPDAAPDASTVIPCAYTEMNDAANDARTANDDHFITHLEGFANFYENLTNCDRDRDLFIVEVDRRIVGYSRTEWFDDADGARIHELICFLDPAWRRRGSSPLAARRSSRSSGRSGNVEVIGRGPRRSYERSARS